MKDIFSQALEKALNQDELSPVAEMTLEKGKRAQIGEIRDWKGQKFQKTSTGWTPVKQQGGKTAKKEGEDHNKFGREFLESHKDQIVDKMPEGWKVIEGAKTAPNGYKWIDNGKSLFSGERKMALIKESDLNKEKTDNKKALEEKKNGTSEYQETVKNNSSDKGTIQELKDAFEGKEGILTVDGKEERGKISVSGQGTNKAIIELDGKTVLVINKADYLGVFVNKDAPWQKNKVDGLLSKDGYSWYDRNLKILSSEKSEENEIKYKNPFKEDSGIVKFGENGVDNYAYTWQEYENGKRGDFMALQIGLNGKGKHSLAPGILDLNGARVELQKKDFEDFKKNHSLPVSVLKKYLPMLKEDGEHKSNLKMMSPSRV